MKNEPSNCDTKRRELLVIFRTYIEVSQPFRAKKESLEQLYFVSR